MKYRIIAVATALAMMAMVVFSGCGKPPEEPVPEGPVEFPSHVGEAVVMEKPLRVATISPSMTDLVVGLGFQQMLVGAGAGSELPIYDLNMPELPYEEIGTLLEPNFSAIKRAAPDLLFTHGAFTEEDLTKLQQMNITVVQLPFPQTIEDAYDNYTAVCKAILGEHSGPVYAEEKIAGYQHLLNRVKEAFSQYGGGEQVVYMRSPLLMLATGDTLEHTLLTEILGYTNLAEEFTNYTYPQDKAVELEPEMIFYHGQVQPLEIQEASIYKTTKAVTEEQLYLLDGDCLERRSPQMFMELIRLTYQLFPEALPEERNQL